jgi:cytochrome c oxidase subunit 2
MWWSSVASASTFMPPAATAIAGQVDSIYVFLLITSLISFIILVGGMIYFVFKYKRTSPDQKSAYITHNHTAEFLWSFIPFCLFMFVFAWGWIVYHGMRTMPENALEVHVVGKKWDWRFLYKSGREITSTVGDDGKKIPATMVVPVGRPVRLIMSSEKIAPSGTDPRDRPVIHSFYIPAFRLKQDVVPGRYSTEWFQADKQGEFVVFCAEYCGSGHYSMQARIKVVSNDEFEKWLSTEGGGAGGGTLADKGRALYASKACIGCHSLDGSPMTGPTWKGMFGRTEKLEGGGTVKVDENYIQESILNPTAKIVAGFQPTMPPFAGQLSDDELKSIIEFIKTVK